MGRISTPQFDVEDPQALSQWLTEVAREFNGQVSFGSPQEEADATSTTLPGTSLASHPGTLLNVEGSWCEQEVTQTGDSGGGEVVFFHNLFAHDPAYTLPSSGNPNVRWLVFGFEHTGTGVGANSDASISCNFRTGDTLTANSIGLRFFSPNRTIDGTDKLKVTLFFTRAVR